MICHNSNWWLFLLLVANEFTLKAIIFNWDRSFVLEHFEFQLECEFYIDRHCLYTLVKAMVFDREVVLKHVEWW